MKKITWSTVIVNTNRYFVHVVQEKSHGGIRVKFHQSCNSITDWSKEVVLMYQIKHIVVLQPIKRSFRNYCRQMNSIKISTKVFYNFPDIFILSNTPSNHHNIAFTGSCLTCSISSQLNHCFREIFREIAAQVSKIYCKRVQCINL